MHLTQEMQTYNAVVVQEVLQRKLVLKMRSTVTSLRKLTTTERITEAGPLTITQEVAKELNVDHSTVVQHFKQIRKVKKLDKWVQHELIPNQKKKSFSSVIFLYSTQQH